MSKNILITGGIEGLGRSIAEIFARQDNWNTCILGRNAIKTATVAEELGVEHVMADATDAETLKRSAATVDEHMGKLAVLVNSVGVNIMNSLDKMSPQQIREVLDVNLLGAILTTRAFLPILAENARIFHIGSYASRQPNAGYPVYSAAKAGLAGFNESLGKHLRPKGISSTLITIGALDTGTQDASGNKVTQEGGISGADVAQFIFFIANAPRNVSLKRLCYMASAGGVFVRNHYLHTSA